MKIYNVVMELWPKTYWVKSEVIQENCCVIVRSSICILYESIESPQLEPILELDNSEVQGWSSLDCNRIYSRPRHSVLTSTKHFIYRNIDKSIYTLQSESGQPFTWLLTSIISLVQYKDFVSVNLQIDINEYDNSE